jgi:hypothetical protein
MESSNKVSHFLTDNWSIIVGVLSVSFIAGGVVSEFRLMRAEIEELKKDTSLKIEQLQNKEDRKKDWIEEQEQRIDDLEEWKAYMGGLESSTKQ